MQLDHGVEVSAPGSELAHQDLLALVGGRDQDSTAHVFGTVGDGRDVHQLFSSLLAENGDEVGVRVLGIDDAVVGF